MTMADALLEIRGLGKRFASRQGREPSPWILQDLTFSVSAGEFLTIVGPSGAGKSTLLNIIAQIDVASAGEIVFDGERIAGAEVKALHPAALLMYRMGDFFEMFFEDARQAAPILEVQLTARQKGSENEAPMCGIPHHALDSYLGKLLEARKILAAAVPSEELYGYVPAAGCEPRRG